MRRPSSFRFFRRQRRSTVCHFDMLAEQCEVETGLKREVNNDLRSPRSSLTHSLTRSLARSLMTVRVRRGTNQTLKRKARLKPHIASTRAEHKKPRGRWPNEAEGSWSTDSMRVPKGDPTTCNSRVCTMYP